MLELDFFNNLPLLSILVQCAQFAKACTVAIKSILNEAIVRPNILLTFRIWSLVVERFNQSSGRQIPSNRESLTKLASRMRGGARQTMGEILSFVIKLLNQ